MSERTRRGEPPDTVVDRLARQLWSGYGTLLHKLTGRYYDPYHKSVVGFLMFLALIGAYGLVSEIEGAIAVIAIVIFLAVSFAWVAYREEQRWRNTDE